MRRLRSFLLVSACFFFTGDAAKMKMKSAGNVQDAMLSLLPTTDSRAQKASGMESIVLELAKQAKLAAADSGNVSELVESIKPVIQDMLSNIFQAANALNASCEASRRNLTGCPEVSEDTQFFPQHFDGDWETLRTNHRKCREEVPLLKAEADQCSAMRDSLLETEQAALETFRSLNIFNSPQECHIASSTNAEDYYKRMYEHFDAESAAWWEAYEHMNQIVANLSKWNCSKPTNAYYVKIGQCQRMQLLLEETACDVYSRTNESCATLGSCEDARWQFYSEVVSASQEGLNSLKDEYRATKRIKCLLEAFTADDMDQAIEQCTQNQYATGAVNATCLDNYGTEQKPAYITPKACSGIEAILSPADKNFRASEYDARGIEAGPCLAPCCGEGEPFFQFNMISDTWVPWYQYYWGTETHGMYANFEDAKRACELATSVRCWGVLDQWCDGGKAFGGSTDVAFPDRNDKKGLMYTMVKKSQPASRSPLRVLGLRFQHSGFLGA
ncbi:melC2 [Symbiodinium natans]|uniref:MelC2 protein n=1 Tax=Symbiodinium natans TaxID=878477 RepID=A0A812RHU0_9DINO|nr:melC2 [Symbiodinium natans]